LPIIDVSQNSYRALIKAAHKRGLSVDRFLQQAFESMADQTDVANDADTPKPALQQTNVLPFSNAPHAQRESAAESITIESGGTFDALWQRICANSGRSFLTKRSQEFSYETSPGYLTVVESGARIPSSQFKKALQQWPQNGPSNLRGVYAASFVWAVLADAQIIEQAA